MKRVDNKLSEVFYHKKVKAMNSIPLKNGNKGSIYKSYGCFILEIINKKYY